MANAVEKEMTIWYTSLRERSLRCALVDDLNDHFVDCSGSRSSGATTSQIVQIVEVVETVYHVYSINRPERPLHRVFR